MVVFCFFVLVVFKVCFRFSLRNLINVWLCVWFWFCILTYGFVVRFRISIWVCVRVCVRVCVMVWLMGLAHVKVLFYGLVVRILFRVLVSSLGSGVKGTCTAWVCNGVMGLCQVSG